MSLNYSWIDFDEGARFSLPVDCLEYLSGHMFGGQYLGGIDIKVAVLEEGCIYGPGEDRINAESGPCGFVGCHLGKTYNSEFRGTVGRKIGLSLHSER